MVASARGAHIARHSAEYGVHVGSVSVNMSAVRKRKQAIVDDFRGGGEKRIESTKGLDWIQGEARFTGAKALHVKLNDGGTLNLTADKIFLDTGVRPLVPKIDGIEVVQTLNSTTIM